MKLYFQIANDPQQDALASRARRAVLDGDPQWIDGAWAR